MSIAGQLNIEDRVSIMELLARYARCLDSGDLEGYVHNFAPDGVLFGTRAITRLAGHRNRSKIVLYRHGAKLTGLLLLVGR